MHIEKGRLSIACVCMVLGLMLSVQFRSTQDIRASLPFQRVEELSARLIEAEKERDAAMQKHYEDLSEIAALRRRIEIMDEQNHIQEWQPKGRRKKKEGNT